MPQKVFIYCLKDPRNGDVRYIGKTDDLKGRFYAHLKTSSKERNHLGNWLRGLSEPPILAVLHEVAENESWQEEERRYIFFARGMGVDLVNSTDGGEGSSNPSPETRAKLSAATSGENNPMFGKHHSPETCAAIGAANSGRAMPENTRQAIISANTGRPLTPAHIEALTASAKRGEDHPNFGKPLPLETRLKIGDSRRGVPLTDSHCANISISKQGGKNPMFGKSEMACPTFNKKCSGASSEFWGVSWRRGHASSKWQATFRGAGGKSIYLGLFTSEEDAARAVDAAERKRLGGPLRLNFPD